MGHRRILTAIGVAVLVAGAFVSGYRAGAGGAAVHAVGPASQEGFALLRDLRHLVKTRYVNPRITEDQLLYGAARGMLDALGDPYTRFMDPQAFREFQDLSAGMFSGIGITMELSDGAVVVVSTISGTPAAGAGLQAGDRIISIDDRPTRDMAVQRAAALIRGPKGSVVHLRVARGGTSFAVAITRAIIQAPSVQGEEVLTPTVRGRLHELRLAYLRIVMFDRTTGKEFQGALAQVMAQAPRGLILDLRNNGGGLVASAVRVADEFVPRGPIVSTVDRGGARATEYATGAAHFGRPLVVLVNEYTASASEIVAGALQDDRLAPLVGVKTFGKGIVQTVFPLPGGAGAAITTFEYLTPAGRSIHMKGLTPDIPAGARLEGRPAGEIRRIQDAQLDRAIEILERRLGQKAS
jgi:carboxyl-terminal processing protease